MIALLFCAFVQMCLFFAYVVNFYIICDKHINTRDDIVMFLEYALS